LVFEKFHSKHIGYQLLKVTHQLAKKYKDTVALAVGLHQDYGKAQVICVKKTIKKCLPFGRHF
jgi:hypothetical protein